MKMATDLDLSTDFSATGYDVNGEHVRKSIDLSKRVVEGEVASIGYMVGVDHYGLLDLNVPYGVNSISCRFNELEYLNTPDTVEILLCNFNNISSLNLNEGLRLLNCGGNPIKELVLPYSIQQVFCDVDVKIHNLNEIREKKPDAEINFLNDPYQAY